jgi:hypothetical protein
MILLLHERSHPESKQNAAKDFPWVQDGEPCFPATKAALVPWVLRVGCPSWKNVGRASVGVVEEDRQRDVLDAD